MLSRLALGDTRKSRNGRHRFGDARFVFRLLICLGLVGLSAGVRAGIEPAEVRELAAAGAPELALALVRREQDEAGGDQRWVAWEGLRYDLLRTMGRWEALAERTAAAPEPLPGPFRDRIEVERAEALLELGRGVEARQALRRSIWAGARGERLATLRRLLIRSYLEQGLADDAYAAVIRYRQDYGEHRPEARLLIARVLLTKNRYGQVDTLLAGLDTPRADALRLLGALRSDKQHPMRVLKQAREAASRADPASPQHWLYWAVAAEAAGRARHPAAQIPALEKLFAAGARQVLPEGLFGFSGDTLWQAYESYAGRVANREQMLVGEDAAWFSAAENTGPRYPIRIRSLYAFLALHAADPADRRKAHGRLLGILSKREAGPRIMQRLYLDSSHFPAEGSVPQPVRWVLADAALAERDLETASRLMQGLEAAPDGVGRFMWQLRRAKVFILAADYASARTLLGRLVDRAGELEKEDVDRLMQLLFDLQTVGEHAAAYALFDHLSARAGGQFKRELLYWMADSRAAQERHLEAARLYLSSATLPGAKAMDPWAQTARYKAAGALADAGLREDAARIYRQLLSAAQEAGRKAVLRRDLEQLWLAAGDG